MNYKTDKNGQPAYIQIYEQMRKDIVNGIYPYGTKLPSKRLVADEVGVSTITVEHAYGLLSDEGYIEPKERSGYFVIFRTTDGFASPQKSESPLDLPEETGFGKNPEFSYPILSKTMRRVMSIYGERITERSENSGIFELRNAIRQYLARSRGITVDLDEIIIGSGSEYLYRLIVELLGKNTLFAIESPSYRKIEQVYSATGAEFERLPLGNDGIDSYSLKNSRANVLHITPYRSFPSGITASASKKQEYLSWASARDGFIVEDDFESEFSLSPSSGNTLFASSQNDNVIYINSFSKTISQSLRVGYMLLPKKLVSRFEEKLGFYSCTVPTFEQLVIAELIANGDFERHINKVRRQKRKEQ